MQKNSVNTAEIKKILPYGAIKKIAKESNKSIFTVSRVLKGASNNQDVKKSIKEYLQEMNDNDKELNTLITELQTVC